MSDYQVHKAAGIIIKDRRVLAVRSRHEEVFVLPGGKVEPGETARQATIRELKEELRLDVQEYEVKDFGTFDGVATGGRVKGQKIRLDMFMIDTTADPVADNEIAELCWITTTEVSFGQKFSPVFVREVLPRLKNLGLID